MNFLALSGLTNFIACVSLGILALVKNPTKSKTNLSYFLFNFSIALYSFGYLMWQASISRPVAERWFFILFDGIVIIQLMYLRFVFTFTERLDRHKFSLRLTTLFSLICIGLNHINWLYDSFSLRENLGFWPTPRPLFAAYLLFWNFTCFFGFFHLIKSLRAAKGIKAQQIRLVTLACAIGYLGGATNWPVWYGFKIPPYLNILIAVYVAIIAYAILRHRLMDFSLLMRWGLAFVISSITVALFFGLTLFAFEKINSRSLKLSPGLPSVFAASLSVLIFDPLRRRIARLVDEFVFKSPDLEIHLSSIRAALVQEASLEMLTVDLVEKLKTLIRVNHAGVAIWNNRDSKYDFFPPRNFNSSILNQLQGVVSKADFLVRTLETERRLFPYGIVLEEELTNLGNKAMRGERTTFWKIRRTMRWLGAFACSPLMFRHELVGFLVMGAKSDETPYNDEDKKLLSHVSEVIAGLVGPKIFLSSDPGATPWEIRT